jgi:ParB family chromosome partitioning protein
MSRRSGLGRGLDALIPQRDVEEITGDGAQNKVSVDAIDPNPNQPRSTFDDEALAELAQTIRELGILQPLLVRASGGGRYELIAGERRLRASKLAGLTEVPVMVVETDDRGSLERAIVENIHRSDLDPIEEAAGYKPLMDDGGLTQEALAARVGRNRVTVTNSLRLLDLPVPIQKLLIERRLTAGHGKALAGLDGNPFQEKLARRVAEEGVSVRETEDLVRKYQAMTPNVSSGSSTPAARPPEVAHAQSLLADRLQTRVRVEFGKRKGKIVLDFASLDELNRLTSAILDGDGPTTTRVTPE